MKISSIQIGIQRVLDFYYPELIILKFSNIQIRIQRVLDFISYYPELIEVSNTQIVYKLKCITEYHMWALHDQVSAASILSSRGIIGSEILVTHNTII